MSDVRIEHGKEGASECAERILIREHMSEAADAARRRLSRHGKKVKLQRAYGGCLGAMGRRRTWQAAKSHGEPHAGIDP
jgi:hypothetical protein